MAEKLIISTFAALTLHKPRYSNKAEIKTLYKTSKKKKNLSQDASVLKYFCQVKLVLLNLYLLK